MSVGWFSDVDIFTLIKLGNLDGTMFRLPFFFPSVYTKKHDSSMLSKL